MHNIFQRIYPCKKCQTKRKEKKLPKGFRKCIRCRKTLNSSEFDENKSYCKECLHKLKVFRTKRKFKIIFELFNGECLNCGINLVWLPSFIFHHLDPQIKTKIWTQVVGKPFNEILDWINKDKIIPLCRNCHELITTKYFEDYRHLILRPNIFTFNKTQLESLFDNESDSPKVKFELKKWIRKRYIIEKLFNGECIACKNVHIFKNLPALTFHHRDPSKKEKKLSELLNLPCKELYEIIIKEDIVCLCGNCHSLLHSDYLLNIEHALENIISKASIETLRLRISQMVFTLNENMNSFKHTKTKIENLF